MTALLTIRLLTAIRVLFSIVGLIVIPSCILCLARWFRVAITCRLRLVLSGWVIWILVMTWCCRSVVVVARLLIMALTC